MERHNIGLLGWGSLAEGFLADDFDLERLEVNDFRRTTLALGRKDNYDKIKEIRGKLLKISRARKMKLVSLVVAWELSHPELTAAIIGVRSPKEAEEMVEAAKSKLTGAELRSFEEAIAGWEPSHTS